MYNLPICDCQTYLLFTEIHNKQIIYIKNNFLNNSQNIYIYIDFNNILILIVSLRNHLSKIITFSIYLIDFNTNGYIYHIPDIRNIQY